MTDKFRNKYRISSTRLQTWDYGNKGAYFITICTRNNVHFFGEIVDEQMQLNEIGNIAEQEWIKTPEIRSDMNLELGEFVVMPNHFHGILIIGENQYNKKSNSPCRDAMHGVSTNTNRDYKNDLDQQMDPIRRDAMHGVSTNNVHDLKNEFGTQSKNLASIIRGFKSSVTTQAKILGYNDFAWQPRFHDHIIRNAKSFENIQKYILDNPKNWTKDKFFS